MAAKTMAKQISPRELKQMKFLTQTELSELLQVRPATLVRWRYSRKGPEFIKVGGLVRYEMGAVESWIQQQTQKTDFQLV